MLVWSVRRRLLYLAIVVGVIALLSGGIWYAKKPGPTCSDNIQNQGELDIDCGGPCAKVCPFEVKDLREIWSRVFPVSDSRYDEATLLRNPNRDHAARSFSYSLRVFDHEDILITTKTGDGFANPGESVLLYQPRIEVGNRVPERVAFEVTDGPVWQRLGAPVTGPKVVFKSFNNQPTPLLTAEISNDSLSDLANIQVAVALSDQAENTMAVSSTLVEKLARNEKREIVFTWPKSFPAEPFFFEFYPHFAPDSAS